MHNSLSILHHGVGTLNKSFPMVHGIIIVYYVADAAISCSFGAQEKYHFCRRRNKAILNESEKGLALIYDCKDIKTQSLPRNYAYSSFWPIQSYLPVITPSPSRIWYATHLHLYRSLQVFSLFYQHHESETLCFLILILKQHNFWG